jgi:hypothetical protein
MEDSIRQNYEVQYNQILKDEADVRIERKKKYAQELDHQIVDHMDKTKNKFKMSQAEKLLNRDNLDAFKQEDPKLYSAVPGWGNNMKYLNGARPDNNIFQKIKKKDSRLKLSNPANNSFLMNECFGGQNESFLNNHSFIKPVEEKTIIQNVGRVGTQGSYRGGPRAMLKNIVGHMAIRENGYGQGRDFMNKSGIVHPTVGMEDVSQRVNNSFDQQNKMMRQFDNLQGEVANMGPSRELENPTP